MPDRRDHSRRDTVRRRMLALFLASPHRDLSLEAVSAALLLPMRACVRILRGFEAVGLVEGTPAGFRARRRSASSSASR